MLLDSLPLVARCSGLAHDLGKATADTQALLRAGTREPGARHEWVSAWALASLLQRSDRALFAQPLAPWSSTLSPPGAYRFRTLADAVLWATLTHHRLPGRDPTTGGPHDGTFLRPQAALYTRAAPAWHPTLDAEKRHALSSLCAALRADLDVAFADETRADHPPDGIWAVAWIARALLVLADHTISADARPPLPIPEAPWASDVWANTAVWRGRSRRASHSGTDAAPRQPLAYHLAAVATAAEGLAHLLVPWLRDGALPLPHVPSAPPTTESASRYEWQRKACQGLAAWQVDTGAHPRLLLTIAPTGSGKTRFHALALGTLSTGAYRATICLPLRHLAYQTTTALAADFSSLRPGALLCVTGEHRYFAGGTHSDSFDTEDLDGNLLARPAPTIAAPAVASTPPSDLPDVLATALAAQAPGSAALIATPVLVSTVDQLLHAGDPTAQGAHAVALLRLFSADLVLDEIDALPADRMQSVLRLISWAAVAGRNVLCSSATLSGPWARACAEAFAQGLTRRAALLGLTAEPARACVGVIDGDGTVQRYTLDPDSLCSLDASLRTRSANLATHGPAATELPLSSPSVEAWLDTVATCVRDAHARLAWRAPGSPMRHSAGVIRVAHIRDALLVATALHTRLRHFDHRLCVLHGQLPAAWRTAIERRLGVVLARKGPSPYDGFVADPSLSTCDGPLIVIATSVIESGSDYCFDWAIADAWSWHSHHQLRGRVMRHRPADAHIRIHVPTWSIKHCRQHEQHAHSKSTIAPYTRPGNWPTTTVDGDEPPSQTSLLGLATSAPPLKTRSFDQIDTANAAAHLARAPLSGSVAPSELTAPHYRATQLRDTPSWRMERWASVPTAGGAWALYHHCALRRTWTPITSTTPIRQLSIDEGHTLWPPLPCVHTAALPLDDWSLQAPTLGSTTTTFCGRWGFSPAF